MDYVYTISSLILIYAMLAASLSLLIGHTGIFSLAHAALFGVGAYASAVLTVNEGWAFLPAMLAAIAIGVAVSAVMAIPSLRVSGDYFIVASLAMQFVIVDAIINLEGITGGSAGLAGVLRPTIGPFDFAADDAFLAFVAIVAAIAIGLCGLVAWSPFGRCLRAIRDDEGAAASLGKPVASMKIVVACFVGGVAGAAGSLYGSYLLFLSPGTFVLNTSITLIAMVIIGGMTSIAGSVLGAFLIIMLPELLQRLDLSAEVAGPLQEMLFGLTLVLLMFLRPQGLLGGGLLGRLRKGREHEEVKLGSASAST